MKKERSRGLGCDTTQALAVGLFPNGRSLPPTAGRGASSNTEAVPILNIPSMNKPNSSSQASVHHPSVPANQENGSLTVLAQSATVATYIRHAVQVLAEHDIALPERDQLNLIVQSALAVQCLYFAGCLHHPDKTELHQVFAMFVMACVTSFEEKENLCPTLKYD